MKIKELKMARAEVHENQKKIYDKADEEKRDLTTDEEESVRQMFVDFDKLSDDIKVLVDEEGKRKELASEYAKREAIIKASVDSKVDTKTDTNLDDRKDDEDVETAANKKLIGAFRNHLMGNSHDLRALQADQDTSGGFLVAPETFVARLIQDKDRLLWFRGLATTDTLTDAISVGYPELDTDPSDPVWTAEIGTGTEDSDMDFTKRALTPHPVAKRIKVSEKLIRVSTMGVDNIVRQRLGYKFRTVEENAFLNGSGQNQPLGVFTSLGGAGNSGVTSDRNIAAGNTTTAIKADNLRNVKYALEAQYRTGSSFGWIFHRDGIKMVSKLKDGEGQYLWSPGIKEGDPDRLLNYPVHESEYAPNTFTTGKRVGMLGDFSFYWIVDALTMTIKVLMELYAETAQIGYIGRQETDGMPVHAKAFSVVTLA